MENIHEQFERQNPEAFIGSGDRAEHELEKAKGDLRDEIDELRARAESGDEKAAEELIRKQKNYRKISGLE